MKKAYACIVMAYVLSGCATGAQYAKQCDSFLDRTIDELAAEWGMPARTLVLPSGDNMVEYYGTPFNRSFDCVTDFIADTSTGRIKRYQYRGFCKSKL